MAIFRNHAAPLLRLDASNGDLDSGALAVRPVDGDTLSDNDQQFSVLMFAEHVANDGVVTVDVLTSYGDGVWFRVLRRTTMAAGLHVLSTLVLDRAAPFIKLRVTSTAPAPEQDKPTFRAAVRVMSSGPFRLVPVTLPNVVEKEAA
jgi:hypothetical protein